jgi:hypothetical protein
MVILFASLSHDGYGYQCLVQRSTLGIDHGTHDAFLLSGWKNRRNSIGPNHYIS